MHQQSTTRVHRKIIKYNWTAKCEYKSNTLIGHVIRGGGKVRAIADYMDEWVYGYLIYLSLNTA